MQNILTIQPPLSDLYKFIDKVPKFPVSNRQLVAFAAKARAPKKVIDFYRTFSDSCIYESRDELETISEQIDLMRQEEVKMPREIERGPEEF